MPTPDKATQWAEKLLTELQIPKNQVRKLQELPVEQLIAAGSKMELSNPMGPRGGFVPTMGTVDLPIAPIDAVARGSAPIPIMLGCTQHEMALMLMGMGVDPRNLTEEQLQARSRMLLGEKSAELLKGYKENHPDYSPGDLLVRAWSDSMRMGAIQLAEAHVKAGNGATYMYLFTWETPKLPHLKAAHGIDGTFYFDNTESVEMAMGNADARALAKKASTAWANFARTGKPSAQDLPQWPEYTLDKRETMVLSGAPHVESDPLKEDRLLRERVGVV